MKDYEILSRATAFLVNVDPKNDAIEVKDGPYGHLQAAEEKRREREYKQTYGRSQASGKAGEDLINMGWLEFVPKEVRPRVHIVCSSHVVAPYLWRDYYPHTWLSKVRQEHCRFALEVYGEKSPGEVLAEFSVDSVPYHHPEGRDISLIHFREEAQVLRKLQDLGVQSHVLRDKDKLFKKGETVNFDGFLVGELPLQLSNGGITDVEYTGNDEDEDEEDEDERIFFPYKDTGSLLYHTEDRFFARTTSPLPEGLCGAPVTDEDGDLCGIVEGIVPMEHKNENLAGCAAFLPSFVMKAFIDFVERGLVEKMMPRELFQMVVTAKKTNSIGGGIFQKDKDGNYTRDTSWEIEYDKALATLKQKYTKEEYDAILAVVQNEREEVLSIMDKEGGDMDEIIERVRTKTMQIREMVHDQYNKAKLLKEKTPNS